MNRYNNKYDNNDKKILATMPKIIKSYLNKFNIFYISSTY